MDGDQPTFEGLGIADSPVAGTVLSMTDRDMRLRDLSLWCRHQVQLIARRSGADSASDAFLFAQAVKLGEEVGELHAAILGGAGLQRSDKGGAWTKDSVASELADVAICVTILAETLGVDLSTALKKKMDKVDRRIGAASLHAGPQSVESRRSAAGAER